MTLWQDVRDAVRQLRRSPGFTTAAVVSLALGIGANSAIFTVLDQVMLRPLPVADSSRLVRLVWDGERYGTTMGMATMTYPVYREIRDTNQVFNGVLARYLLAISVSWKGTTERVAGELVSGNYFDVLGVRAAVGRTLTPDDDRVPGGHPLAVLSHAYWVSHFAADPTVVGRAVIVDGQPLTIVGVAQAGFAGVQPGATPRLWIPIAMKAQMSQGYFSEFITLQNPQAYWVDVMARLKPGLTREQAFAGLQPTFAAILARAVRGEGFKDADADARAAYLRSTMRVEAGEQGIPTLRAAFGEPVGVLMAIVVLVLVIACANVANLLLERAIGRRREIAIRLALGAPGWQVMRQALVESLWLACLGGGLGLLIAAWTTDALIGFGSLEGGPLLNVRTTPDVRVLGFTLITCVGTGVLFGLAPAFAARRVDPAPALQAESRAVTGRSRWFRSALVVAQIAVSLVLLIGAGQFLRTVINLRRVETGLRADQVIVFSVDPGLNGYGLVRSRQFYRTLLERVRTLPGVESASASAIRVLADDWWSDAVRVEGDPARAIDRPSPNANLVSPGYLETLGIPLRAGRDFQPADAALAHRVALVNETFVRMFTPGRNPVGVRIALSGDPRAPADIEIVGVMGDAKYATVRKDTRPQVFLDNDQNPDIQTIHVYVKTALAPEQMAPTLRRAVQALDPHLPIFGMRTMTEQTDLTIATERMVASLAAAFGALATVLASIGIYALMAFSVTRRTREIAIRVALGARRPHVMWLVLARVLGLVAIGTGIALPAAWALARLARAQLFEVSPADGISMALAAVTLAIVAALAGAVPARRATAINPIDALRNE